MVCGRHLDYGRNANAGVSQLLASAISAMGQKLTLPIAVSQPGLRWLR
jgi:hypothetical protein